MNLKSENDILEETLAIAAEGYEKAYRFLMEAYEKTPEAYGPQTLYFLACLAGGAERTEEALGWPLHRPGAICCSCKARGSRSCGTMGRL